MTRGSKFELAHKVFLPRASEDPCKSLLPYSPLRNLPLKHMRNSSRAPNSPSHHTRPKCSRDSSPPCSQGCNPITPNRRPASSATSSQPQPQSTTPSSASSSPAKPTATQKTTRTSRGDCAHTTPRRGGSSPSGCRRTPRPRRHRSLRSSCRVRARACRNRDMEGSRSSRVVVRRGVGDGAGRVVG